MKINKSDFRLISLSAIFTSLFGIGYLGRNVDICVYGRLNNRIYNILEPVGSISSGLTIFDIYIGQLIIAITIFSGLIIYIINILKQNLSNSSRSYIFNLSYICSISLCMLYPFYNYFTNALRQGIGIGLTALFLSLQLYFFSKEKPKFKNAILTLVFLLMLASHKSTVFICILLLISFLVTKIIQYISSLNKFALSSLILSVPLSVGWTYTSGITKHYTDDVIGNDLGVLIAIFSFFVILILTFFVKHKNTKYPLFFIPFYQGLGASMVSMPYNAQNVERLFPYFILAIMPYLFHIIFIRFKQSYVLILSIGLIGLIASLISPIYDGSFSLLKLSEFCARFEIYFD